MADTSPLALLDAAAPWLRPVWSYGVDAAERAVLYADLLHRRGQQFLAHNAAGNPPVLRFDYELVLDGRDLPRKTSYQLLKIIPPEGMAVDPAKRPYVIIDPRAGQGPGIGGSQTDSQVGVALRAGHPCYFVSFGPHPEPTQTIEDITAAEVAFLEEVRRRHPEANGDPVLIGNCQAGWAVTLLGGANPDKVGPIVLAGTPLAYWDGPRGASPMRYFGGLMGGAWLGELASDLGNGRFDGAYLVQNFEGLNPANTYLRKPWRVYERIDTEAERFLEFERWWGGFFLMNADEIRFISSELFIGNKLSRGELRSPSGHRIDIRNIRSPIVVLTSHGDRITPPAQALNWILDLYRSVEDIRAAEQTIVYCVHPDVGHLGIFVSGRLAEREHAEFIENIDLIELLPPGLYEAVITEIPEDERNSRYVEGRYATKFKARTLDDLRRIGGRSPENTARFAAVAKLSAVNSSLYRRFAQPVVRRLATERGAEALRQAQPVRLRYTLWSQKNPLMRLAGLPLSWAAGYVRSHRHPVADDNPLWQAQRRAVDGLIDAASAWSSQRDRALEAWFEAVFGGALTQGLLGLDPATPDPGPTREFVFDHLADRQRRHLDEMLGGGGLPEAVLRATMYVLMADHSVDERGFNAFKQCFRPLVADGPLHSPALRTLIREQQTLLLDRPKEAIAALPRLLPRPEDRTSALEIIREIASARGPLDPRRAARIAEIEAILGEATEAAGSAPAEVPA